MEQGPPWEGSSSSFSQEIPHILSNIKFAYCGHNSSQLAPVFNLTNPPYTVPLYFFKFRHNTILSSTHRSSKWFLSFKCLDQNPTCISFLLHMCNMTLPSHPPWFYYQNNSWLFSTSNEGPHNAVSSHPLLLLGPSIFLSTRLSYTPSLWPIA